MNSNTTKQRAIFAITAMIVLALSFSSASAWGRFGGHYSHFPYGYYNYGFYHHGYYGWPYYGPRRPNVQVIVPPIGAYVAYLPDGYTTFVIGADRYYCYNDMYFQPYGDGYVIVSPPVRNSESSAQPAAAAQPQEQPQTQIASTAGAKSSAPDTVTVGVPNSKGGFTSVKLVKHKDGYMGPQGEFYAGHPTVDQLKTLYGN